MLDKLLLRIAIVLEYIKILYKYARFEHELTQRKNINRTKNTLERVQILVRILRQKYFL